MKLLNRDSFASHWFWYKFLLRFIILDDLLPGFLSIIHVAWNQGENGSRFEPTTSVSGILHSTPGLRRILDATAHWLLCLKYEKCLDSFCRWTLGKCIPSENWYASPYGYRTWLLRLKNITTKKKHPAGKITLVKLTLKPIAEDLYRPLKTETKLTKKT